MTRYSKPFQRYLQLSVPGMSIRFDQCVNRLQRLEFIAQFMLKIRVSSAISEKSDMRDNLHPQLMWITQPCAARVLRNNLGCVIN